MRGIQWHRKTQRQQPLVFFFATRGGGYTVEATTSLSLSVSLTRSIQLLQSNIDNSSKLCALSHIYTYMAFRHIYISVLPIGRYRSGPVLWWAGSLHLPSGFIRRDMFPNSTMVTTDGLINDGNGVIIQSDHIEQSYSVFCSLWAVVVLPTIVGFPRYVPCLNSGHSTVDCTMRTQCMISHSQAHMTDRCEYNLLNR